jgi:transcriptional regulator with GAF, ATPase, and Fis domain
VRELENAVERASVLSRGEEIRASDLLASHQSTDEMPAVTFSLHPKKTITETALIAPSILVPATLDLPYAEAKRRAQEAFDDAYVRRALVRAHGKVAEAARLAGLDPSNFRRLARRVKGPEAPIPRTDPESEERVTRSSLTPGRQGPGQR